MTEQLLMKLTSKDESEPEEVELIVNMLRPQRNLCVVKVRAWVGHVVAATASLMSRFTASAMACFSGSVRQGHGIVAREDRLFGPVRPVQSMVRNPSSVTTSCWARLMLVWLLALMSTPLTPADSG